MFNSINKTKLLPSGTFCKISPTVISRMWQLLLWHCHWKDLASEASDGVIIFTLYFRFLLRVYEVNFLSMKNRCWCCWRERLSNTHDRRRRIPHDIGICNYWKVICTSGFFVRHLRYQTQDGTPKSIVLQSAINEATFEALYNALMVTITQLSLGYVSCR